MRHLSEIIRSRPAEMPLELGQSWSSDQSRCSHLRMLVLRVVLFPKFLPRNSSQFQLGVCAVRGVDVVCFSHVYDSR
jgi:hypothetical protein